MLIICGNAFSLSYFLQNAYAPFLHVESGAYAYFLLNLANTTNAELELKNKGLSCVIGTTTYVYIADCSKCIVNSYNYQCLAEMNFSLITIRPSYLNNMTYDSFTRLNEALYQVARFRALFLNMLVLHASAVVYRDDAWILNYDKPVVKLDEERVLVSGSPWGGKEDLAINEVRPAKALFFVHQAKENRVVRLSSGMAYAEAHLNYFVYPLNADIEKRYNDSIIQLIKKVPVYDLYCTDTAEAVEAVKRVLYPEEEER